MNNSIIKEKASCAAAYQITVIGKLPDDWSEWFDGTEFHLDQPAAGIIRTILTCQVHDQAELFGILFQLNSLNLPLLDVSLIEQ